MLPQHKKLRVAVLMGGPSSEHEVSLKSGEMVAKNLNPEHYDVRTVLITKGGDWEIPVQSLKTFTDVAFIALHGPYGEDGTVQDLLEQEGIPYTGTGPLGSALAMNKFLSQRLFREAGLNTPLTFLVTENDWKNKPLSVLNLIHHYLGYPLVVKPNNQGSSVGVTIVKDGNDIPGAFHEAFHLSKEALIQEYISGREVTCGVLDNGLAGSEFALLPTEIIPKVSKFFDYRAKYDSGGSEEITPPKEMADHTIRAIQKIAQIIHRLLGCRGFSRTDMILDKHGRISVLEVNTIPGLTPESLLPKAAIASGISFPVLVSKVTNSAFLLTTPKSDKFLKKI